MKKVTTIIFSILFFVLPSFAQTTLVAGDIAILGMNCDNPDDFSFLLLKDIDSGTQIKFTENGWFATGGFRTGEGTQTYTAPSNLSAGTKIIFSVNSADFSGTTFGFSTSGDQILAYQGDDATPTFIYALNNNGSHAWDADASSPNTSALPTGSTNGVNAVAVDEMDNVMYNGSTTFSSSSSALSAISDYQNWIGDNSTRYDFSSIGDFTLPVELTSFTAKAGDGQVVLRWNTASEINNQGFVILRSTNQAGFYKEQDTYTANNDLKGAGNSSHSIIYEWADNSVINGNTYWYKLVDVDMNGVRIEHGPVSATPQASESAGDSRVPHAFYLTNYPNPFGNGVSTGNTTISFDLSASQSNELPVTLTVYDLLGRKVVTLYNGTLSNVAHRFRWNGKNAAGLDVPAGVYIYKLAAPFREQAKKMILIR